jgi:hypothetical protein
MKHCFDKAECLLQLFGVPGCENFMESAGQDVAVDLLGLKLEERSRSHAKRRRQGVDDPKRRPFFTPLNFA